MIIVIINNCFGGVGSLHYFWAGAGPPPRWSIFDSSFGALENHLFSAFDLGVFWKVFKSPTCSRNLTFSSIVADAFRYYIFVYFLIDGHLIF